MITIDDLIEAINEEINFEYGIHLSKSLGKELIKYLKELKRYKTFDKENDIIYLVRIKLNVDDELFYKTICSSIFSGSIVNQTSSNFYFKLKDSNDIVIIPHNYIEWMAPSGIIKMDKEKGEK